MHSSITITATKSILTGITVDMGALTEHVSKVMDAVFQHMQSSEERELSAFILAKLGPPESVLKNDALLRLAMNVTRYQSEVRLIGYGISGLKHEPRGIYERIVFDI